MSFTTYIGPGRLTYRKVTPGAQTRRDLAEEYTERRIKDAARRLRMMYHEAAADLERKQSDWKARHLKRVEKYQAQLKAGLISKADYEAWMRGQIFQERAWALKRGQMARAMVDIDKKALEIINSGELDVFAENANYMGFLIDSDTGAAGSFGLYDRRTVLRLIRDQPNLLPMPGIDEERDYRWYNDIINNAVTQGILTGETLDQITLRVAEEAADKSLNAMKRSVRTACTGAQNAGRVEGMRQARDELGIEVKKRWMATLDSKTRNAHADLDGQVTDVDEPFESILGPIMYPGDPDAVPANVYNCRCTLTYVYPKYNTAAVERTDAETGERVGAITYREWMKLHSGEG